MSDTTYIATRGRVQTYFDDTAVEAWKRLTSEEPVSGIRATVRAGRDRMRNTLLGWLPVDLDGARILDAGCGTGAMAIALAARGANVVAIDLSPRLIEIGRQKLDGLATSGSVEFRAGDMLDPALGTFDFVVAMDSLIHYRTADAVSTLASLGDRTRAGMLFTFAPRTPLLAAMHAAGRLFPRSERAPSIEPVATARLRRGLLGARALADWRIGRGERIASGFYISEAMELRR
jgi:magnesium-protoporphyrin O-methyltransferase